MERRWPRSFPISLAHVINYKESSEVDTRTCHVRVLKHAVNSPQGPGPRRSISTLCTLELQSRLHIYWLLGAPISSAMHHLQGPPLMRCWPMADFIVWSFLGHGVQGRRSDDRAARHDHHRCRHLIELVG